MASILTDGKSKNRSGYSKTKSRPSHKRIFPTAWQYNPDNIMSMNNRYRQTVEREINRIHQFEKAEVRSSLSQNMLISQDHKNKIARNWESFSTMDEIETRIKRKEK